MSVRRQRRLPRLANHAVPRSHVTRAGQCGKATLNGSQADGQTWPSSERDQARSNERRETQFCTLPPSLFWFWCLNYPGTLFRICLVTFFCLGSRICTLIFFDCFGCLPSCSCFPRVWSGNGPLKWTAQRLALAALRSAAGSLRSLRRRTTISLPTATTYLILMAVLTPDL